MEPINPTAAQTPQQQAPEKSGEQMLAAGLTKQDSPTQQSPPPASPPPTPAAEKKDETVGYVSLADMQKMVDQRVADTVGKQVLNADQMIARHQFLTTTMKNFPLFVQKMAPMTGDEKTLQAWGAEVEGQFKGWLDSYLDAKGMKERFYNLLGVGGRPGGQSIANSAADDKRTGTEKIAAGLRSRAQR